jgi:ComF family protein
VRRLVAAWKERGLRRLAEAAADVIAETVERPAAAVVVFVPPDHGRTLKRGHHAAGRLAKELATRWELPASPLLVRARPASRQRGLSRAERRRNLATAFAAAGRAPPRVALVDDVFTTGATAHFAASALRKAGARRVEVVTFARTIRIS